MNTKFLTILALIGALMTPATTDAKPNKQHKDRQAQNARVVKPQKAQRQVRTAPKQYSQSPAKRSVARSMSQATAHRAEVQRPERRATPRIVERAQEQGPRSNVQREFRAQRQSHPQQVARERQGSKQRAEVRRQLQADHPRKVPSTMSRAERPRSSVERQSALTDKRSSPNERQLAPRRPRSDETSSAIVNGDRETRTPRDDRDAIGRDEYGNVIERNSDAITRNKNGRSIAGDENRSDIRRNVAPQRDRIVGERRSQRPPRAARPERWANERRSYADRWKIWDARHATDLQQFRQNRAARWNRIAARELRANVARDYRSTAISNWRRDVIDYRRERAIEVWDRSRDLCDNYFDDHWWHYAWWNPHPRVIVDVSPWWWWRPATWTGITAFFGPTWSAAPVYYDPGVSVVYEGDEVYIDGSVADSVADYDQAAYALANPAIEAAPVPAPVAEGQQAEWLPLGVWAFTQEREGDAVMFFQMSIDKNGIVGGAFKNALTGDEQPIVGKLDRTTQRVAWHVGDLTDTVYDTYLPNLTEDVASVFVHLGKNQTQTWLMVRLPSPEMPPGAVKIPTGTKLSAR